MKSSCILHLILFACLVSGAASYASSQEDRALQWFHSEYGSFFKSNANDTTFPTIFGISVMPSSLQLGDPRAEISAFVYDPVGIKTAYAEVGGRMNLMLDLQRKNEFKGYCGSNLPPGTYEVTVMAIDKAGNAARSKGGNLTIRDPKDMNGNHVEDALEKQSDKDLRVIVLHDGILPGADKFKILPASSMTISGSKLDELSHLKGIKGIYKDQKLKVLASPGRHSPPALGIDDPRKERGLKGDDITIALMDTGADPNHESLKGNKIVAFKDFVNNQSTPYDDNGHGTHCASLIAGNGTMSGVAPDAKLVVVKVMDKDGACYLSDAIKALDWCMQNKDKYDIKAISFSVGGEGPSDGDSLLDLACNKMVDRGIVMCVAAGNSGPAEKSIVIPGDAEKVITVGAVDNRGTVFERSSRGPSPSGEIKPDIVTLGVDVISALSGSEDQYSSMSGTSMAVPQVTGAAALLLEARPDLKPSDIKRILLKTADDLGQGGPDNIYGYGAMNLTSALTSLDKKYEWLEGAKLMGVDLSRYNATVGDSVNIEAEVFGDVKDINARISGPDKTVEIPLEDFDSNGIYSSPWETGFWTPGNYLVEVNLLGRYGETEQSSIPFRLDPKS